MEPRFFATPEALRAWFAANHDRETELVVGYYKKATGIPSITWQESVDEALCYGWIDSIRKSIDDKSYSNRFTPRKTRSTWSAVNIRRVEALIAEGRMTPAGIRAYEQRKDDNSAIYSYEQERQNAQLPDDYAAQLRANELAWAYFQTQSPSYQRGAAWWVISAKQEATRLKRLAVLIDDSAQGRRIAPFRYGRGAGE